jgi:hypothetical protein
VGRLAKVRNVSLNWLATNMPIRHPGDLGHYLDGFRRAGLA